MLHLTQYKSEIAWLHKGSLPLRVILLMKNNVHIFDSKHTYLMLNIIIQKLQNYFFLQTSEIAVDLFCCQRHENHHLCFEIKTS